MRWRDSLPGFPPGGSSSARSEHGGGIEFGREAAGRAAAATEMASPDVLRLPEIGLRMIVDLLPPLGDRPV